MTFSPPLEGNKIASIFPFETFCKFLEQVSLMKCTRKRKHSISAFIQRWGLKYRELVGNTGPVAGGLGSFYPVLRLLIPSADRARAAYGIGEPTMARILVKAFGLAEKGPEATQLLGKQNSSISRGCFNKDLADIVHFVLKDYCAIKGAFTIKVISRTSKHASLRKSMIC